MEGRPQSAHINFEADRASTDSENTPEGTNTQSCNPGIELLGYAEVAAILRVSPRTLRRLVDRGAFPSPMMIGRAPRWSQDQVTQFLSDAQTKAEKRSHRSRIR